MSKPSTNTTPNIYGRIYVQSGTSKAGKPYTMLVTLIPNPYGNDPIKILLTIKSPLEQQAVLNSAETLPENYKGIKASGESEQQ
jgi:hypothetical protein